MIFLGKDVENMGTGVFENVVISARRITVLIRKFVLKKN